MNAAPCTPQEAERHLRAILGPKANPSGSLTMAELLDGACFAVQDGGQVAGVYVLRGQGAQVWVQAAAGRAGVDLCDLFDDLIAKHGQGFRSIGFKTHRPGLVRKALARGYQITSRENGYTMTKAIK